MPTQSAIWLDGAAVSALPLPDRGLDYGDGLFETLLLQRGHVLYADLHLQRLQRGLQALSFPDCLDAAIRQLQDAASAVRDRAWPWSALRLTITRGSGPRGYAPPLVTTPRIIISAVELDRDCHQIGDPAALSLASVRWPTQPALAGIKHLNRLEQVLASAHSQSAGTDESVMLDQSGHLVSVASGNLFLLRGRRLLTPRLDECGIDGTRRRLVMQKWAPSLGLVVDESRLSPQDLETADEAFFTNSLLGLRPVASFGKGRWHTHELCAALYGEYRGDLA